MAKDEKKAGNTFFKNKYRFITSKNKRVQDIDLILLHQSGNGKIGQW